MLKINHFYHAPALPAKLSSQGAKPTSKQIGCERKNAYKIKQFLANDGSFRGLASAFCFCKISISKQSKRQSFPVLLEKETGK